MAAATAFCWEVVKFDVGAAEALALLVEPELVTGGVGVVAEEEVVVVAAARESS